MKQAIAAAAFACLTGCPYDELAADTTQGDGGLWFGNPNDGGVFLPQNPDASGVVYLTMTPSDKKLCKLDPGDYTGIENHEPPKRLGTWIGDVESSVFFGEPAQNAEQLGVNDAQVSYHWPSGGILLRFLWIQTFTGPLKHGTPWPKSFFLSDIQMEGDPPYQDCWREALNFPGAVPCPECQTAAVKMWQCDPYPCRAKDLQEAENNAKK